MWLVTRHQYGISALVSQKSFRWETSGGVAKCPLFAQATFSTSLLFRSFKATCKREQRWELLRSFWQWCANGCDNSQQHAARCNKVCKRTQHVTFNNVWSCQPTMFRPFAWDFTQQGTMPLTVWNLLFTDGSLQVLNQNPNLKEMKERSACGLIQININRTWPRLYMVQRRVEFSLTAQCLQN